MIIARYSLKMTTSTKIDLASLQEGTRYLTRRPLAALGIAALGMLLASLAAVLQIQANLPEDPMVDAALTFASLLPLELYFIPRFLIATDAQAGQNPLNTADQWRLRFEERWLRAFWGKAALALATGIGLSLFIIPGLMVLMAFGWAPLRILLRGESILQAAKGSVQMMARSWRRVILATSAMAMVYLSCIVLLSYLIGLAVQEPTVRVRLTHPLIWVGNFFGSLLSVWLSACLLALFRRLETAPPAAGPVVNIN
jgi:hypothetical protein